ncbi:MAG: CAP domain-containing protein [Akkermansiaceae bacterium]|jgi:uncharacterized protein YkwD
MIKFAGVLTLAATIFGASGQEKDPAMPNLVAKKALQWMQNSDPEKRAAAYRTFQLYGDEGGAIYRRILEKARDIHTEKLSDLLEDERANPFAGLDQLADELNKERTRIYALIKTDYKKDPAKIAMLNREMESLAKLYEKAQKLAAKDGTSLEKSITAVSTALSEVHREINLVDGEKEKAAGCTPKTALEESFEGSEYLKTKATIVRLQKEKTDLEKAHADNDACSWANASQKTFTRVLNDNRALFALTPLRLEERLSQASVDHSRDMATMGFFAHQSPVPGKKTPNDRAKKAGFKHRWTGENIFVGSGSPLAAYNAWFGSDGHRFIMFAKGPNLIGIGPHGRHWTMMTGKK